MRAIVLLPADAVWRPLAEVRVLADGDVDPGLPHAAGFARQVELELQAVDERLDELLEVVGRRALELGGVALDARSLRPIVEPEQPPARVPDDPGPIWEHLPGDWAPGPATGAVVDAFPAIENIERGIADVQGDDPADPGPPAG